MHYGSKRVGSLALITAALIWGGALVLQGQLADKIPPFLFNALRSYIGGFFLWSLQWMRKAKRSRQNTRHPTKNGEARDAWRDRVRRSRRGGLLCGILLSCSLNLQQFGLFLYPEGIPAEARCGFLCSLHVIFVPLLTLLLGKRLSRSAWISVLSAGIGVYLLCLWEGLSRIYLGDVLMLLSAFFFSLQILTVARLGRDVDPMSMIVTQFLLCGSISLLLSLLTEQIGRADLFAVLPSVLLLGIFASGIAYPLQIIGQRSTGATVCSVCLSLESVFATIGGWLFLGHALTLWEIIGCAFMLLAILLAQLPEGREKQNAHPQSNAL
ncbi:MAG: DMT family transporter [Clostridia bacterium]|nr:DMT family transporter [Clostridia bacterium]